MFGLDSVQHLNNYPIGYISFLIGLSYLSRHGLTRGQYKIICDNGNDGDIKYSDFF